jgi:hypothetical protein
MSVTESRYRATANVDATCDSDLRCSHELYVKEFNESGYQSKPSLQSLTRVYVTITSVMGI